MPKNKKNRFILSNHARERYKERIGTATDKEIIKSCEKGFIRKTENNHRKEYRIHNSICFVVEYSVIKTVFKFEFKKIKKILEKNRVVNLLK